MAIYPVQTLSFQIIGSGATAGGTTFTLQSFKDILGTNLSMSSFGSLGFGTIEPNTTNEDSITFTGITQNSDGTATLTGVNSVLFLTPFTTGSGLRLSHAGSVTFIITNTSAYYSTLANKNNDEVITGTWTFDNFPITPSNTPATTAVAGIVQLATQAQILSKTATGSTGASLVPTPALLASTLLSDYKADTGTANTYAITPTPAVTAYTVGQIFSFKAANSNTGSSTINVNGLGAKNIVRTDGTTALSAGMIVSGQIVKVEYDGTSFQMTSVVSNPAVKFGGTGADGPLTVSSGNTNIDLGNAAFFTKNYSSISITGTGSITFINPNSAGTVISILCSGNATLTSSTLPYFDTSGCGAAGGAINTNGTTANEVLDATAHGDGTAYSSTTTPFYLTASTKLYKKAIYITPGSGGKGSANGASGSGQLGGRGGGAFYMEVAGTLNMTGTGGVSVAGKPGLTGTGSSGGSGGGAAGWGVILYNTAGTITGNINDAGGTGGTGGPTTGAGGAGAGSAGAGQVKAGGAGGGTTDGTTPGGGGGGANMANTGTAGTAGNSGTPGPGGTGAVSTGGIIALNTYFA